MSQEPPPTTAPLLPYKTSGNYDPPQIINYNPITDPGTLMWIEPSGQLACRDSTILPHVCVVCGDTEGLVMKMKQFTWVTPLAYLGLLGGVIPAIIIVAICQKKAMVSSGLCAAHRKKNRLRILTALIGLLPIPILIVAAIQLESAFLGILCPVVLVAVLIYLAAYKPAGLQCGRIENKIIYFKNAGSLLLQIVQNTQKTALK